MTFSQIWDALFRTFMIYVGVVFAWLLAVENHIDNRLVSLALMNLVAVCAAGGFFLRVRKQNINERERMAAEVRTLMEETSDV